MPVRTFGRHEVGKKFHVEYPVLKHVENSLRGSRWAKSHNYRTTDLDILPDEVLTGFIRTQSKGTLRFDQIAGHIWNGHWPDPFRRDGFKDPKRILGRGDHMDEMVPHEIERIVAHSWFHGLRRTYHIPHVEAQLQLCGSIGLQVLLEPKHSPVYLRQEVWDYLAMTAESHGCRTAVYSLMHECLPFARNAGFAAWPI